MNGTVEGNEGSARKRPRAKWPQFPEEVKSTPIDVTAPYQSTPFSTAVGDDRGTSAILGFDHNLLRFSTFVKSSLRLIRGYSPDDQEDPLRSLLAQAQHERSLLVHAKHERSLLAHAQHENEQTSFGWGLRIKQSALKGIERGFSDNRWPTQREDADDTVKKSTSYVKNGKLIQAVVIASAEETSINWTIGGKIQLLQREFENSTPSIIPDCSVQPSPSGTVLSVIWGSKCRLDVQLFDLQPHKSEPLSLKSPVPSGDHQGGIADIFRYGKLDHDGILEPKILVAVFALRDLDRTPESTDFECPDFNEVMEHLALFDSSSISPTPIMDLEIDDKTKTFSEMKNIIARNVEQLMSTAALPRLTSDESYLIDSLTEHGGLEINYKAIFWHIRLLTNVRKLFEPGATTSYHDRILNVVFGTIRNLFNRKHPCRTPEDRAFRALTVCYALRDEDGSWGSEDQLRIFATEDLEYVISELQPEAFDATQPGASTTCLLQLCHRRVLRDFRGKQLTYDLEECLKGALKPSRINVGSSYERINREEQWNQLALLAVELLGTTGKPKEKGFASKLIDEVANRLKKNENRKTDGSPPWGYRCMDHCLRIELELAKLELKKANEHLRETLEAVYCDCLYFLRSDYSFLKSWDASEPTWTSDLWSLECSSIVSSSLLSIAKLDWSTVTPNSSQNPTQQYQMDFKLGEILEALRDISQPKRKELELPWRDNVRMGYSYYPQFMQASLETCDASRDRHLIEGRSKKLSKQNQQQIAERLNLSKKKTKTLSEFLKDQIPGEWSLESLEHKDHHMRISDFPLKLDRVPQRKRLAASRVSRNATYRFITVDFSLPKLLAVYLSFAHSDAWDTVVDFFGTTPVFRGSLEGRDINTATGGISWYTSISLPHFILGLTPPFNFPSACIAICITGDNLGEFWTCSIIGNTSSSEQESNDPKSRALEIHEKTETFLDDLETYKYDKYSTRNLIFIFHLTEVCHTISERYEVVLERLTAEIDIKHSKLLYQDIARATSSEANKEGKGNVAEQMNQVTVALRRTFSGMEQLENLDKTLRLTVLEIEKATAYVKANLAKRRRYWPASLEDLEERIWIDQKGSFARLEVCRNQIDSFMDNTGGVRDNLIFLSNLRTTTDTLTTSLDAAKDAKFMITIAILTTLFLPFTFVAVLFTTPMFKWPDPPEGQILITLPFVLYWVFSVFGALILAIPFYIILRPKPKSKSTEYYER